jgi:uncharacterized repeat protein (TIGR01451 family)
VFSVDLAITKTDGVATYTPGASVTYSIVVSNAGPADATNATVADTFPASVNATWTCVATGGASCTAGPVSGNINDTVDVPVGDTVTYTVTGNIASSATGPLSNTATVTAGGTDNETAPGNNSATDTDAQNSVANLSITKTDNSTHYVANGTKTYTIVVSNTGPSNVTGATVTDVFSTNTNIAVGSANWTCSGAGGGACTVGGSGDINDTVNLPAGASVTYVVGITVVNAPAGNLVNTATVAEPVGVTDPAPGNNSATDTDQLITSVPFPNGNIGDTQDFFTDTILPGNSVTFAFGTPLNVGSHPGWDLVYYELQAGPGVQLDHVELQISDGSNWFTIFTWGNGFPNTNTIIPAPLATPPNPTDCGGEPDNCAIDASLLFNTTGIAIDLDLLVPNGDYYYIRIISPTGDDGDGTEVDAIVILP